ncbi:hypothetical protein FRC14_002327 [Serendipita sp. 396]|nr:hypothetical protein FRC14_002327 [Serendipita sp. 396]KAG8782672.1 hypothetical protein FRC15_006547 [Serendipita sp. 397]
MGLPETVTDGGRLSTEGIINKLAAIPHVSILVTIRSNTLPSDTITWDLIPLEGVGYEDARAIFISICPAAADHPSLNELLEVLGYMPYAVTLMAKQAVNSFAQVDGLLAEWKRIGTNSLSQDLKEKMNRSIGLSVDSRAISSDPDAQCLLAILAKLPSGTNLDHLKWWAKRVDRVTSAIGTLNNTALITQRQEEDSSPMFYVLPVVQSYLHEQPLYNSPTTRRLVLQACCAFLQDHKSEPGDPDFKAHVKELDIEKTNIQTILHSLKPESLLELGLVESVTNVFDAMLTFGWYQFWTRPSTETLDHILRLAPSSNIGEEKALRYTAEAHICLGRVYIRLAQCEESYDALEKARREFLKLGTPSDRIRAGHAALYLSDAWCYRQRPGSEVEGIVREAQEDLKDDPRGTARALMYLGEALWYRRRFDDALQTLQRAKEASEKCGCRVEIVECLLYMTRSYALKGALEDCLKTGKELLQAARSSGANELISDALVGLSRCYIRMKRYDDALVTLKESRIIHDKLGYPKLVAIDLELSGYAYAKKGDRLGATIAYDAAKRKYDDMEETDQTRESSRDCEENLRKLEQGDMGLKAPYLYDE